MFGVVSLQPCSLADYRPAAGERACRELTDMARQLRGLRVLHLSALGEGTRTATLLRGLVPLMNAVGVAAEWQVVPVGDECKGACDALYRALARGHKTWTPGAHAGWLRFADASASMFDRDFDFVVVHDPQILALLSAKAARDRARPAGHWIWHCHLDLSGVQPEAWGALRPHLMTFDAAIYSAHEYVRSDAGIRRVVVIPQVLDPISMRNQVLEAEQVERTLRRYALDPRRPLLCFVGPMIPETDPIGLLDAFALARPQLPSVNLALVADTLGTDKESRAYLSLVAERARQDEVRLLSQRNGVGDGEINALQRAATVAVQRASRRGQSPGVLEAMWKSRPVVAGRNGGLGLQVSDGKTGYLADSNGEFGLRLVDLLRDGAKANALGVAGHERVRRNMLITRCLRDYLALFQSYG